MKKAKLIFRLIIVAIIVALSITTYLYRQSYNKAKDDAERHYNNLQVSGFEMRAVEAKNGELYKEVSSITLRAKELEVINKGLSDEVKNLNVKAKNLESLIKLQYSYLAKIDSLILRDTVFIERNKPSPGKFVNYEDQYLTFYAKVDSTQLKDIRILISDTLLITWETKYKGFWFWKKPVSVTAKIKNESPYMILRKTETYVFKN